ncbi:MAG: hypothetical protein AAB628_00860 [Patescibacteria group bacterium]
MSSKSVEKFLNSPMSSLKLTKGVMTTLFAQLSRQSGLLRSRYGYWHKRCTSCFEARKIEDSVECSNCSGGYIKISNQEIDSLKDLFSQTAIQDWLMSEDARLKDGGTIYGYGTWNKHTDVIGKVFLNKGFGYLCWWRLGRKDRMSIFKSAVKNMGKDFVLSMPLNALPFVIPVFNWVESYCEIKTLSLLTDREAVRLKKFSSFEDSIRILQGAGFTKKDGSIFDLDLKIESEAGKLRAKYPRLNQRTAKLFLEIAKQEGW